MSKQAIPCVSVVIPAYNSAGTLRRAIDSVLGLTFRDWELIVVDDGSQDGTAEIAESYRPALGQRLSVVRQDNGGSSRARNRGLDLARGEFVAFLDADDEFLPDKLSWQVVFFERCPQLGLVYSDMAYVDLAGRRHPSVFAEADRRARPVPSEEVAPGLHVCGPEILDCMVGRYIISPITAVVRRSILGTDVRFPVGQQYSEEWLFFLEVVRRCPAGFVARALSLHHHTAGSLTRTCPLRNCRHQARAIETILDRFPQASRQARAEARDQLLHCYRQLGMDYYKRGDFRLAAGYFARALGRQPSLRGLVHWIQARMAVRPVDSAVSVGPDPGAAEGRP